MRVIKFPLTLGHNTIRNPHYLEPKWIEWQGEQWMLWCQEYTQLPEHSLKLYLATTGEHIPPSYPNYIGTATTTDKSFVVHLFGP